MAEHRPRRQQTARQAYAVVSTGAFQPSADPKGPAVTVASADLRHASPGQIIGTGNIHNLTELWLFKFEERRNARLGGSS